MLSVLLIDDDANFRIALAISLRLEGVDVHEAASPSSADDLLAKKTFDAVLIHVSHPETNARLITRIRERFPSCKVILSNSHQEILDAAKTGQDGSVIQLLRPFSTAALLEEVRRP